MQGFFILAKRFTDTGKWKKPLFRKAPTLYKLLFAYIFDNCDHAGIWQVDIEVAQIELGCILSIDDAIKHSNGKIIPFKNGEKWYIPGFIEFQYGELNPANKAHLSVIQILKRNNLTSINKPLTSPLQGTKDMDKDKELVMDKELDKEIKALFPENWHGDTMTEKLFSTWIDFTKHLQNMGKKFTNLKTIELMIMKLYSLSDANIEIACAILNESICNEWVTLNPLKQQKNGQQQKGMVTIEIGGNKFEVNPITAKLLAW